VEGPVAGECDCKHEGENRFLFILQYFRTLRVALGASDVDLWRPHGKARILYLVCVLRNGCKCPECCVERPVAAEYCCAFEVKSALPLLLFLDDWSPLLCRSLDFCSLLFCALRSFGWWRTRWKKRMGFAAFLFFVSWEGTFQKGRFLFFMPLDCLGSNTFGSLHD
jgi:hypothetical protein